MRLAAIAASCATVLLLPAAAHAQDDDWSRPGFYLGAGGGGAVDEFDQDIQAAADDVVNTGSSWLINGRAGYRVNSWFAVETVYEYMDNLDLRVGANAPAPLVPGDRLVDTTTHTTTVHAKFIAPWWRIQPYLSLGLGAQYSDVDFLGIGREKDWQFAGRPAGGFDFYITRNLVLFGEVAGVLATSDVSTAGEDLNDLWYISIGGGLGWRF
jgi:hypothetical protein